MRNLNLDIPAGQSVALVGVNGVGKSTVVKLMCGIYAPCDGNVRIDGRDPHTTFDEDRKITVIFQDFTHYELSLRENIILGAPDNGAALQRALTDAQADQIVAHLSDGADTVLSPAYPRGTDLSGGQWQRVALARALYAIDHGAGLLILDEPTAALDIRSETELFERFLTLTRGVTTVLVSHRLSSVRRVERIIVLGPDGILEDGSHDELMRNQGPYFQMFTLQAERFSDVKVEDG